MVYVGGKYKQKWLFCYDEPNIETVMTLNHICTLFHGYESSGLPKEEFSPEFYDAVGKILNGKYIKNLNLKYLEITDLPV